MKKVLIVSYSFPPLNNIASRRFGEIASYLSEYNWEPYVLTTNSSGTLPIEIPKEKILRYGSHPQKNMRIKKENDNENIILKKILNIKRNLGLNMRVFDRTYFNWYKRVIKDIDNLKEKDFDLIIASFGPGAALFLGRYLSRNLDVPWIADFRDLGSLYKDDNFKQNTFFNYIDRKVESSLISNASAITSIGNNLSDLLGKHYGKPAYAIFNGWKEVRNNNITLNNYYDNYIYYAGRFYPHQMESIFKVINILVVHKRLNLVIRSLGPEKINKQIIEYAKEKRVSSQLILLEPTDQETVLKESQLALVNLVVEDLNKDIYWKKGTLTGKLLSLLPLKPPILAVARDDSEIGDILNGTGKGKLCSNESEIESFFSKFSTQPSSSNISFYSKKNQAKRLVNIFNEVLNE